MALSRLPSHRLARPEPEVGDPFAATRMPAGEHLEELRRHLWRAALGLGLVVVLCFALDAVGYVTGTPIGVGKPAMELIVRPVDRALEAFHERRVLRAAQELRDGTPAARAVNAAQEVTIELDIVAVARRITPLLGLTARDLEGCDPHYVPLTIRVPPLAWELAVQKARHMVGPRQGLAAMNVTETMMVYVKVTLVCALVLASPWVFWQLWAFVAAGLYAHERRYVYRCLPFSLGLFLGGVLLGQFLVVPGAVDALLGFNEWLAIEPDLRLSEWLSFALLLPLVFGLAFQTPLVMVVLNRLGIVGAATYRRQRRLAWFLLAVFAAVVTPTDFLSMFYLWLPLGLLYELGIWICRRTITGPGHGDEEPDGSGALLEV
jgi:sec-independent protein translocase protein TatC